MILVDGDPTNAAAAAAAAAAEEATTNNHSSNNDQPVAKSLPIQTETKQPRPPSLLLNVEQLDETLPKHKPAKRKPTDEQLVLPLDNGQLPLPDGGYGWVVVFASFMCNLTVDGICYTFGIFLPHFIEYFDSNEAVTALSGAFLSGCYMTVGVFVSSLVNRFGCRPVTMVGSILAALSFALSTKAPNVYVLIVTYGIITGSCFGLIYLPSIVSVGHYFTNRRAFATGIAVCGSGMGAFLFAPICQLMLSTMHWKQALLILSGCISACSLYGILMRPLVLANSDDKQQQQNNSQKTKSSQQQIRSVSNLNLSVRSRSNLSVNSHSSQLRRSRRWTMTSQLTEAEAVENMTIKNVLDLAVLTIPAMALLAVSNAFGMIGYYIPYVYIVRFATEQLDIDSYQAAWILSAVGISNVIGRLVFGLISDRFNGAPLPICPRMRVSALFINNVCLLLAGISVMAIPFCQSFWILLFDCIIFGFTISSYMSLTSVILVELLSLELLTTTFGLISCVRGVSSIIGPPMAGLLYEYTNSYTGVFIASGMLLNLASLVSFIVHRYEKFD